MKKPKLNRQTIMNFLKTTPGKVAMGLTGAAVLATVIAVPVSLTKGGSKDKLAPPASGAHAAQPSGQTQLGAKLEAGDFTLAGQVGAAKVSYNGPALDAHLQIEYSNKSAKNWSIVAPTSLKNGDTLLVRLAVKAADQNGFAIAPNELQLPIVGLQKQALSNVLAPSDFTFGNHNGQKLVTYVNGNTLHPNLQVEYLEGTKWSPTPPHDFINGSSFAARLALKDRNDLNYTIAENKITVTVSDLVKTQLSERLKADAFTFAGASKHGQVTYASTLLDPHLQLEYMRDAKAKTWTTTAPSDLQNGDQIQVRLAVKPEFQNDFAIGSNHLALTATNLNKIVLQDALAASDFTWGFSYNKITLACPKASSLDAHLQLAYALDGQNVYAATIPALITGQIIHARLELKDNSDLNYDFNSITVDLSVPTDEDAFLAQYPGKIVDHKIVDDAFRHTDLPSGFTLPSSVTSIGDGAFVGDNIPSEFTIPKSVQNIGFYSFGNTSLPENFTIPASTNFVTSSQTSAFTFADINTNGMIWLKDGFPFTGELEPGHEYKFVLASEKEERAFLYQYPDSIVDHKIVANAFKGKNDLAIDFEIPSTVTAIDASAFEGAKLSSHFKIPLSVTTIDLSAFKNAQLPAKNVWMQDGVEVPFPTDGGHLYTIALNTQAQQELDDFLADYPDSIVDGQVKENAFLNRKDLPNDFALPSSVTSLAASAFAGATLPSGFALPDSVVSIGASAFKNANLAADFALPSSVTSLAASVFEGATLPSGFALPDAVDQIGEHAFDAATIPAGFTSLPRNLSAIGDYAFHNTLIAPGFTIPASVKTIGANAFESATIPAGFRIPASVTSYDASAFANLNTPSDTAWFKDGALFKGKVVEGFTYDLLGLDEQAFLKRHPGAIVDHKIVANAFKGQTFNDVLPSTVVAIGESAFQNATLAKGFVLPNSVTSIGVSAFQGAKLPSNLLLPDSVTSIGDHAFQDSLGLGEGFTIKSLVTTIGNDAFANAVPLGWWFYKGDVLANDLVPGSEYVIKNTDEMEFIAKYPGSIVDHEIVKNYFKDKTILPGFAIPKSVTSIGEYAFDVATLPVGFKIPDSVKSIGEYAFYSASLPSGFAFPSGIDISQGAFEETTIALDFTIPVSTNASPHAFANLRFPSGYIFVDEEGTPMGKSSILWPTGYVIDYYSVEPNHSYKLVKQ